MKQNAGGRVCLEKLQTPLTESQHRLKQKCASGKRKYAESANEEGTSASIFKAYIQPNKGMTSCRRQKFFENGKCLCARGENAATFFAN